MDWWTLYISSVIVMPTIFGAIWVSISRNGVQISDAGDVLILVLVFMLLWPFSFPYLFINHVSAAYKDHVEHKINEVQRKISSDRHDRTYLVQVPENELKFIARMYRKGKTNLSADQFEMIREELMHRNAEKALLR